MKIIGHRGARGLAPENTVAALKKALEYKVDEVEFDLWVTLDGKVVLRHVPPGHWLFDSGKTHADLKAHNPNLATFEDALEAINRAVPMYVEIKPHMPVEPIVKIIQKYLKKGWQPKDFQIASFDQKVLRKMHRAMPELPMIVNERWSGVRAAWRARQLGTKRVTMDQRWLWSGFIKAFSSNHQLMVFTMNDPAKAKRWARYGLYGVVTDRPDLYRKR